MAQITILSSARQHVRTPYRARQKRYVDASVECYQLLCPPGCSRLSGSMGSGDGNTNSKAPSARSSLLSSDLPVAALVETDFRIVVHGARLLTSVPDWLNSIFGNALSCVNLRGRKQGVKRWSKTMQKAVQISCPKSWNRGRSKNGPKPVEKGQKRRSTGPRRSETGQKRRSTGPKTIERWQKRRSKRQSK
jgi:hypothetical protein